MGTRVPTVRRGKGAVGELTASSIRQAREAAGWSIAEAARRLINRSEPSLPTLDSLIRSWKRWEAGATPSRFYRPLLADLLGFGPDHALRPTPDIPRVFVGQSAAVTEIRAAATEAHDIDVLAVRGLGVIALNDSLLRPAIDSPDRKTPLRVRVLLSRPGSPAAASRAAEVGERPSTLDAGIDLAVARIRELGDLDHVTCEIYQYDTLPVWRIIGIDNTLYVSVFAEHWEGHESAVYKIVASPSGALHHGFRRMYEDLRSHAARID